MSGPFLSWKNTSESASEEFIREKRAKRVASERERGHKP